MENSYIKELIMALEHTEICHGNYEEVKSGSYDEGISLLVDMFSAHKEKQKQLLFYREWRQFCDCKPYDGRLYEKRRYDYI